MSEYLLTDLGPLGSLAGVWEGDKGDDLAPSNDRGIERNRFRERMTFVPIGAVDNHEQKMFGLRYATVAHRIGVTEPFHEEVGYWLWEPAKQMVLRCFLVPRGVSVIAAGRVDTNSKSIRLIAECGSPTNGICSNEFLDREFKTTRYELNLTIIDPNRIHYEETTTLRIKGQEKDFFHTDKNQLIRVG